MNSLKSLIAGISLMVAVDLLARESGNREIEFPDLPGYLTLVCDLHQHTAFSDGSVWPNIRVEEGLRDGLDAIAVTEHLEYQPHRDDIPHPDRNRAFQIATDASGESSLLIIPGAEVTRDMPPGHSNAIFIEDANRLLIDDPLEVFQEAARQGAFVFWNHPSWNRQAPDGVARLTEMHEFLIAEGLLHGIEVVNEFTYSDEALQIALDNNLTIMGTSDIHGLIDWDYEVHLGGHRPVTLVFAEKRTPEAIKEALMKLRTVVWHEDALIGRKEWLLPLLEASLTAAPVGYLSDSTILGIELRNHSDASFVLKNTSAFSFYDHTNVITVEPHSTLALRVKTLELVEQLSLEFEVLNALVAPRVHPTLRFDLRSEAQVTE